jgi:uncharacterized protein (DUF2336 family)
MVAPSPSRFEFSEYEPLELNEPHAPRAKAALTLRLCEIVSWPESRIPSYERQLAADVLLGLLRTSNVEIRRRCAEGMIRISDAPKPLLRYLARDEIRVADELLQNGLGFDDSDLISVVRSGITPHWQAIAKRKNLTESVTDALLASGDATVTEAVLRNQGARLSSHGVDLAVARSRQAPALASLIVTRMELRPTQALVLFWWAPFEARVHILRRFAVDRSTLIAELGDVFKLAAEEHWADADARKALQVIERRQRNRAAAAQSVHGSLEGAIALAEASGVDRSLAHEIAHLSGIKPTTAAQIFSDTGGEAIGVYCKSVGLRKPMMLALWRALRRPSGDPESTDNPLGRAMYIFDTLATAKAQTVLRYWNWSFTADAANLEAVMDELTLDMSVARRNASLLFGRNA